MGAATNATDLVTEVEELLAHPTKRAGRTGYAYELLRRMVEEVKRRDRLIVHMHVHSGYPNNGYMQMTTPQKELYDTIWNRSIKELDDEE